MRHILIKVLVGLSVFQMMISCSPPVEEIPAMVSYPAEIAKGTAAIWHPDRHSLFWIDLDECQLYEYNPEKTTCQSWHFDAEITTAVPETDSTVVITLGNEIVRVNLNDGSTQDIALMPVQKGKVHFNDGKCDPVGRLWIGTTAVENSQELGTLYTISPRGKVICRLHKVTCSNGIAWTTNKRFMYYVDKKTNKIIRYRYSAEKGEILYDGVAVTIPKGSGSAKDLTIDSNDRLWVAQWGGEGVCCYSAYTGELLKRIKLPTPYVTSCAFGGKKMDTLYITTARAGLSIEELQKYPLSGSLFCCYPGVKGGLHIVLANSFFEKRYEAAEINFR